MSKPSPGDPKYYGHITYLLLVALAVNGALIFVLNTNIASAWLGSLLGPKKAFVTQLFFWAALAGTIASSLFMKHDKDINELESLKDEPDPTVLRYPDIIDVGLYLQRILTSGFLGIVGAAILFAGLGYFDVSSDTLTTKHKLFLVIFSFLIGLYQSNFLTALGEMSKRIFQKPIKPGKDQVAT
jgi:hypothetical protein